MFKIIAEERSQNTGRQVEFRYHAAPGRIVSVAGSFNDWDPDVLPMRYFPEQKAYIAAITLEPGDYEYKFVVNGNWQIDEGNPAFIANDFGTLNSVVSVE